MLTDWPKMLNSVLKTFGIDESKNKKVAKCLRMSLPSTVILNSLQWDEYDESNEYTLEEVAEHCHPNDCWIIVYDKVYDVTDFLHEHPGGDYIIGENAGRDATLAFRVTGHSEHAYDLLDKHYIGKLVKSQRLYES